jgi:hypothetical protein
MKNITIKMTSPEAPAVLAGRVEGQKNCEQHLKVVGPITVPTMVVLDFSSVELATSSYLDEVTLKLRNRLADVPAYVLVANMASQVLEEFEHLLIRASDAFLVCDFSQDGKFAKPRVVGKLDENLKRTFDLAKAKGEVSATELHAEFSEKANIGATAWNNRLNALANRGLLYEIPIGRAKKYRPTLGGAEWD